MLNYLSKVTKKAADLAAFLSSCLVISLTLVSCTKQVENKSLPPSVEEQYQSADQQIGKMLDDLNNQDVPL